MIDTDDLSAATERDNKKATLHPPAVTVAFDRVRVENYRSDDVTVFKFGFDNAFTTQVSGADVTDDAVDYLTEWVFEVTTAGGRVRRNRGIDFTDVVDGDRELQL